MLEKYIFIANQLKQKALFVIVTLGCFLLFHSCGDKNVETPAKEYGIVTDIDGHVYTTVLIGEQWWMTENLKVTKFRNGTLIPQRQQESDWINTTSAYCLYSNSSNAPGLLYNFYAVNDTNKIAPAGWHIPTDAEWAQLELFLGMTQEDADNVNWRGTNEADKLKIESPLGWTVSGNIWSTNESGFTASAGSCRLFNGVWGDPGIKATGFWWSSTGHPEGAWYRYLDYKKSSIFRYYASANYGFSIRCVKD